MASEEKSLNELWEKWKFSDEQNLRYKLGDRAKFIDGDSELSKQEVDVKAYNLSDLESLPFAVLERVSLLLRDCQVPIVKSQKIPPLQEFVNAFQSQYLPVKQIGKDRLEVKLPYGESVGNFQKVIVISGKPSEFAAAHFRFQKRINNSK